MKLLRLVPPDTKIDFIGMRFWSFAISALTGLVAIAAILVMGLNFGIDFKGGLLIEVKAPAGLQIGQVRSRLSGLGLGEAELQQFGGPTEYLIRLPQKEGDQAAQQKVIDAVKTALGSGIEIRRTEFVGPKVGAELVNTGIWAVALAMLAIMGYVGFRFEWQFGLAAIIALAHDVVMTVGLFALFQLDFNLTILAAVLTLAGYSVNDTVVIFDRIRENMRKYKTMALGELMNLSINETLSRTVLTHLTVFLTVSALYIFGGAVINGFAIVMLFGVVVGTYSSVFVAAPLLLYMGVRRGSEALEAKPAP